MKKFLIYFAIYFMIGTILTVGVLAFAENYIYNLNNSTDIDGVPNNQNNNGNGTTSKISVPDGAKNVEFSFDNKYYTYLLDNEIYINNVKDGSNVDKITEKLPICYYKLLHDKNRIMYFMEDKNTNSSYLHLMTYEISSKKKSEYNKLNVSNFSKVVDIYSSPVINIMYFDVETKVGNTTKNNIYRIDLFNNLSKYLTTNTFENAYMLQTKDKIYYQDSNENVYSSAGQVSLFNEKVKLLGIDGEDNIYFYGQKTKDTVYKVTNNKIVQKIKLDDNAVIDSYCNYEKVYLIYSDYVIDVSSSTPNKKVGRLSEYVDLVAIKGDSIYIRVPNGSIVKSDLVK
jgi:hypothetical protein